MLAAALLGLALSTSTLFATAEPLQLELTAPLTDLFSHDHADPYTVSGVLVVNDNGHSVRIDGIHVSLRGHTSLREDECVFPKLKVALPAGADAKAPVFTGLHSIKIGTHCGEAADDQPTKKYG